MVFSQNLPPAMRLAIIAVLVFQFSGCGTLLYPERRGMKAGHLDVGIVILDAIGLLFFLIPGIIAFAVDFSNGCIYLPATAPVAAGRSQWRQVKFDPKHTSVEELERIIKKETGRDVKLTADNVRISRIASLDNVQLAMAGQTINRRVQ